MSGKVILIADDDPTDVLFLRRALTDCSNPCVVFDVADGQEAIDYLAGRGKYADRAAYPVPGQLFLDLKMPRVSGLEVLEWLRQQPHSAQLPVVIVSGSHLPDDVQRAKRLGADYLVKPLEYEELREMVCQYCRKGYA